MKYNDEKRNFIDSNLEAGNKVGLERIMIELGLQLSEEGYKLTRNRPLADKSAQTYGNQYRGLMYFCSLLGDYESMLILKENRPRFCPAMSPRMIANFIKFKRLKRGRDIYGRNIKCQGGWNDPDNVKQLLSAVGALHAAAENSGQCIELDP